MRLLAAKSWCLIGLMVISLTAHSWGACCCAPKDGAPVMESAAEAASTSCCCCEDAPAPNEAPDAPTSDRCDCTKACCAGARILAPAPRATVIPAASTLTVEFALAERSLTPRDVHLDLLRPPQA